MDSKGAALISFILNIKNIFTVCFLLASQWNRAIKNYLD
jgi:hypothetical protein